MDMRSFATLIFFALALSFLPACAKGCGKSAEAGGRTQVAVSIFPIYDLVRRVAGPDADVALLVEPGHNAHSFDPTPKDIAVASKAKLGVMVGLGLDPWMETLVKQASPDARILKVGDRVPPLLIKDDARGDDQAETAPRGNDDDVRENSMTDPHCWLDPQRARLIVRAIAEELSRVDGAHTLGYRDRATVLDKILDELDQETEARTRALKHRGVVTFHEAFRYFAERYKLDILGVIEPVPGSPPTSESMAKVRNIIKTKSVRVLFSEPQLDSRPAMGLADEAKIPLGVLDPIGGNSDTDSYEKMIRFDVSQLEKFLN